MEARREVWRKEGSPLVEDDCVRDHLAKLDTQKNMGPNEIHPQVLRDQMLLLSHAPSSLKDLGELERLLKTRGKPKSLQPSKRVRRKT